MNITKRLYTYPVLSEERDDYNDSVFDADVQYKMNGVNNLLFDFDFKLDFFVSLHTRKTYTFRTLLYSCAPHQL